MSFEPTSAPIDCLATGAPVPADLHTVVAHVAGAPVPILASGGTASHRVCRELSASHFGETKKPPTCRNKNQKNGKFDRAGGGSRNIANGGKFSNFFDKTNPCWKLCARRLPHKNKPQKTQNKIYRGLGLESKFGLEERNRTNKIIYKQKLTGICTMKTMFAFAVIIKSIQTEINMLFNPYFF